MGKIHAPFYRVVVVDSRKKRDGKVIEEIGKYNPLVNPSLIEIDSERAQYWLGVGAQPSDAVRRQLEITGDWAKFTGEGDTAGSLQVETVTDEDKAKAREEAISKVQDDAEKRRAEAAEAKLAAEAEAAAEDTGEESAEDAPAEEAAAESEDA